MIIMIRSTFGFGKNDNARKCVLEAVKDFKKPKLILFFSDEKNFCEYTEIIYEMFPGAVCMGCSSYRLWNNTRTEKKGLNVIAIEDGIICSADVIEKADNFALGSANKVRACMDNVGITENTICAEFTVPYKRTEEYALMALNSVLLRNGIPVIGGTAANICADKTSDGEAYVSLNGKVYTDGCVFAVIHSLHGSIFLYRENIYEPLTGTEFTVTKSNSITRTVMTYDKIPAADVYANELNVPRDSIKDYFFHYPMGQCDGEDTYVTAIHDEGSNGSLKHHARVHEGTKMMVMKEGDYKTITRRTIETVKSKAGTPSLVLMFHCVARTILFEDNGYIDEYQTVLSESFPNFIGFACLGEQLGTKNFNHTMMLAVFE